MLRELNATGRRRVPADAPADFVPTRWQGYLTVSEADGRAADYRHYWELSLLYRLQAALRSGDVWVRGSRRYADPASYLIGAESWPPLREEFCALTGTSRYARDQLARLGGELTGALGAPAGPGSPTPSPTPAPAPTHQLLPELRRNLRTSITLRQ